MWRAKLVAGVAVGCILCGGAGVAGTSKSGVDAGAYQERRADISRHARDLTALKRVAGKQSKREAPTDPAALVEQFPEWSKLPTAMQVMRDHTEHLH